MYRLENCERLIDQDKRGLRRWSGKVTSCTLVLASISIVLSCLTCAVLLWFSRPALADAEHSKVVAFNDAEKSHPLFDHADLLMLHEHAQQIGSEQPALANITENRMPHPHFHDTEFAELRNYAE